MTKPSYDDILSHLKNYNQEHLITFWDSLTEEERTNLVNDINEINFEQFIKDVEESKDKAAQNRMEKVDNILQPPPQDICGSFITSTEKEIENYESIGLESVSRGEYCAILMAGGAGTRLGVSYPKGMYSVGLASNKSLFQIQAERILRLQESAESQYGTCKPLIWYVMTSECTRDGTVAFFKKNNYFGLIESQVIFFEQFTLPVMGIDGKILLESKSRVAKSPDGNGGLYRSLHNYEMIKDMSNKGIKYAFVYGVDNILVKIADPVFLGFCISKKVECAAKVVEKTKPDEAVGVVGVVGGKFQVVEYSEINSKTAALLDPNFSNDNETILQNGELGKNQKLLYRSANICTHLFSTSFLAKVCQETHLTNMPQHIALKKVPYIDIKTGSFEKPTSINGIKMEKFVFDVFPLAESFAIWEVSREDEFSPLKNAPGSNSDCPETSRESLLSSHKRMLLRAAKSSGYSQQELECFENKLNTSTIEISSLVSYRGENLAEVVEKLSNISNGSNIIVELVNGQVEIKNL